MYFVVFLDSAMAQAVTLRPLAIGGPGSLPDQFMWGFCWTKWHWDRVFSEFISFFSQYHSTRGPYLVYVVCGMNSRPVGSRSLEKLSHPTNMNNNMWFYRKFPFNKTYSRRMYIAFSIAQCLCYRNLRAKCLECFLLFLFALISHITQI
jgi:hypothetical protein